MSLQMQSPRSQIRYPRIHALAMHGRLQEIEPRRDMRAERRYGSLSSAVLGALLALATLVPNGARAQDVKIRDLTIAEGSMPVRLMGYGIVTGLDGTGDRAIGGQSGGQTVQSVVNLLRRFDIEVPADVLRMRNVAAVLVTAEVSPYLRAGGRFEIQVSSMGDARSLRGGVLWMTPLVADAGGQPVATAQGSLMLSQGGAQQRYGGLPLVETSARIPSGGLLEGELARPVFASASKLVLKEPDEGTASRIAAAINAALGAQTARVEDPGSVVLVVKDTADRAGFFSRVRDLTIKPDRASRLVIDGRDGTVVAGGEMTVSQAVVSHGAVTLTIGAQGAAPAGGAAPIPGDVRLPPGVTVQQIAAALHAVQTPPQEIAAIFEALREVGAIMADVVIR